MLSWTQKQLSVEVDSQQQGRGANDLPSELNVGGCEWGRERVRWGVLCNLKSSGRWVTDCLVPFCYPTNASSSQSISTLIFYSTFKIYQKFDIMVSGHCIRISSFPTCRKLTCMKYIDILAAACLFSYSNQWSPTIGQATNETAGFLSSRRSQEEEKSS